MQADGLYPDQCKRNYKSFVDGLIRVTEEKALMRGALANGLKLAGMVSVASATLDWMKENMFFFFGPIYLNKLVSITVGVATATAISMPCDTVRNRLHTMRPLPNDEMPYKNTLDCFNKIVKYECSFDKQSNFGAFYTGGQAYFGRLLVISLLGNLWLEHYHATNQVQEYWQPARFHYTSGIDYDIHDPYTDGFNRMMIKNWMAKGGHSGLHPDGKS